MTFLFYNYFLYYVFIIIIIIIIDNYRVDRSIGELKPDSYEIVHLKMKILSIFTRPNLYDFLFFSGTQKKILIL